VSGGISWESHEIEDASLAGSLSADEFQNSPLESSSVSASFEFLDCDTQVEGYVQSVPDVIGLLGEAAELPAQVARVASILRGNKRRGGTQGKVEGVRKEFWKRREVWTRGGVNGRRLIFSASTSSSSAKSFVDFVGGGLFVLDCEGDRGLRRGRGRRRGRGGGDYCVGSSEAYSFMCVVAEV